MLKTVTIKGLTLGIIAGLLVTLFDGLFMLTPNTYVPPAYPFILIAFNICFWMAVGSTAGLFLWLFVRNKKDFREKESFYWALFFLVPFAIIYGLLGRFNLEKSVSTAFDHNLSFLWVLLILSFIVIYFKKRAAQNTSLQFPFIVSITAFILLFQFCSNISKIRILKNIFQRLKPFLNFQLAWGSYLTIIYIAGVLFIAGFFFIFFLKIKPRRIKQPYVILVLFLAVAGFLTVASKINYTKINSTYYAPVSTEQNFDAKKVPQVILIVLDTVRADRLSVYGRSGVTKNLELFSRDAVVFENCIASSPWTLPSHASIFTGLYPAEHGSHGNLDGEPFFGRFPTRSLPDKFMTLAEIFKDNGYLTAGIVSNYAILHPRKKIHQGFQIYDCTQNIGIVYREGYYPFRPIVHVFCLLTNFKTGYTLPYRNAEAISTLALHVLDSISASPLFLFINYMDAHSPYLPPRPYDGYFLNTLSPQFYKLKQYIFRTFKKVPTESWDSFLLSQYDGEIAYLDDQLGILFSRLREMKIYDSSLIIITSDHGELFGENGCYEHDTPMYQGVVKVPLIIKFPYNRKTGRKKGVITSADVYATILSICDLPVPAGTSGKPYGSDFSLPVVSEYYSYAIGKHQAIFYGNYKYMIYGSKRGPCYKQVPYGDWEEPELYDLAQDPLEQKNLAKQLPEITQLMEKKLGDWEKAHRPKYEPSTYKQEEISEDVLDGLRALGYMR